MLIRKNKTVEIINNT